MNKQLRAVVIFGLSMCLSIQAHGDHKHGKQHKIERLREENRKLQQKNAEQQSFSLLTATVVTGLGAGTGVVGHQALKAIATSALKSVSKATLGKTIPGVVAAVTYGYLKTHPESKMAQAVGPKYLELWILAAAAAYTGCYMHSGIA